MLGRYIDLGNPVSDHPLNAGLVSWWLGLPNVAGTTSLTDLKGVYTGTLTNFSSPLTQTSGWVSDRRNPLFSAVAFDGSDDVGVVATIPTLANATTFTFSCRAVTNTNSSSSGGGGLRYLMAAEDIAIANGGNVLLRYYPTGGYVEFLTNNGAAESTHATDSINPTIGVEYHWVGVGDGTYLYLYRDGNLVSQVVGNGVTNPTAYPFRIGNDYQSAAAPDLRPWSGTISDCRYYTRALAAADVAALYQESVAGHPNTLRRYSRLVVSSPAAPSSPVTWKLKPNAQAGTIWDIYS